MRQSDVIDVTVIARHHVGGILDINKERVKMRNSDNFTPRLFVNSAFQLAYNSTHQHKYA